MFRLAKTATVLGAVLMFGVCATPAPAAKGVKKTGEHHVRGTVVSVTHDKKGHGTLTVRVTHHKHKKGQTALQKHANHTFTLNHHTHVHGASKGRTGLAALHTGEHVTVAAHHHHADQVTIHHHHKKKVAKG
jgi:hypothetical protein